MFYRGSRNRTKEPDDSPITFPLLECWNPLTRVASLAAQVHGKRVLCRISFEILQQEFHASAENPMKAVVENRSTIEAAARTLIKRGAYEDDGSILIRRGDI